MFSLSTGIQIGKSCLFKLKYDCQQSNPYGIFYIEGFKYYVLRKETSILVEKEKQPHFNIKENLKSHFVPIQ